MYPTNVRGVEEYPACRRGGQLSRCLGAGWTGWPTAIGTLSGASCKVFFHLNIPGQPRTRLWARGGCWKAPRRRVATAPPP